MPGPTDSNQPLSLFGPLQRILIPRDLGFHDPDELGRALASWRYQLSHDEVRLLEYLAQGLTNEQIAAQLGVAEENTVKNRIKTIFRKMGVRNRVQAATIAAQFGLTKKPTSPHHPNG